jgi:hypothetical protein
VKYVRNRNREGNAELGTRSLSSGHSFRINSVTDCKLASFSVAFLTSRSLASGKLSNAFKDVKQLADNCEICQESKPRNCRETLKQHDNGAYPWNKIGLDIFEIKGRNYLIAVFV